MKHILVAGASGLVGNAVLRAYAGAKDFKVTALSRRCPQLHGAGFLELDLMDAQACDEALTRLGDVTHLVYAALYEKDDLAAGWIAEDQIARNDIMLRHLFEPLSRAARGLEHVCLLQGTKAYGAHVRRIPVPAREDRDELKSQANFYWNQEDYLRRKQTDARWELTIIRPQIVFGDAVGAAMNPIAAIGLYAALLKDEGEPLHYPGSGADMAFEAADAKLVGRVIRWSGEVGQGRGQSFNVTNGDVFVWRQVWPAIADALGMKVGDERPQLLAQVLPPRSDVWDKVRHRHNLIAPALMAFAGKSLAYADLLMHRPETAHGLPALVSTIRLRHAGFAEVMDSEDMFRACIARMQAQRLLPRR
ncbi:MAG: NAD-dependent epimerase/dehydratase family protein [Alphaproteobacteria bacterium]|nr:NAD-dependent epimerase/dehydratase family protein [Alphaproteobacteria bacterium]